jgi:Rrf2 family protein
VDYGVRALVDLAQHADESSIRASEIAKRQLIPEQYLARVLHSLQRHGLTKAQRGPTGGHSLARNPSEITMGAVLSYLGNPIALVTCLDDAGNCGHSTGCGQRSVWQDAEAAMWKVLNSTTIADLVDRTPTPVREKVPA